jgi:hypothetical protein
MALQVNQVIIDTKSDERRLYLSLGRWALALEQLFELLVEVEHDQFSRVHPEAQVDVRRQITLWHYWVGHHVVLRRGVGADRRHVRKLLVRLEG